MKSVTGLAEVDAWSKFHQNCSRRTEGRVFWMHGQGKIDDHEVGGEVEDLGEHDENLETKEVFYTFNKIEQTRGGHKEIFVPIRSRSRQWQ